MGGFDIKKVSLLIDRISMVLEKQEKYRISGMLHVAEVVELEKHFKVEKISSKDGPVNIDIYEFSKKELSKG